MTMYNIKKDNDFMTLIILFSTFTFFM